MGKLTPDQIMQIIEMYLNGESALSIAKKFNVSKPAILYQLRHHNIERRQQIEIDLDMEDIIKSYRSGESTIDIAKRYNTSHTTIIRHLKQKGVVLRTKEEALQKYVKYTTCVVCGKEFRVRENWKATTNSNRKTCSKKCFIELMKEVNRGENAGNWRGGYSQAHYQRVARELKPRQCQFCGRSDVRLDVHHIDHNRKNNSADNLMILCASCHAKMHYFNGDAGIRGAPRKKVRFLLSVSELRKKDRQRYSID